MARSNIILRSSLEGLEPDVLRTAVQERTDCSLFGDGVGSQAATGALPQPRADANPHGTKVLCMYLGLAFQHLRQSCESQINACGAGVA